MKSVIEEAIERERRYRDRNPCSIGEHLKIMKSMINEAIGEYYTESSESALEEIIQLVAIGHICLEQYIDEKEEN